ncbi:Type II secretion system protein D [compost metagenome]
MVSPSPTSNALIVTASRNQLDVIRQVVQEIDRPRRQVIITAVVAELADSDFEALGLNVGLDSQRTDLAGISLRPSDKSDLGFSLTFSGPTLSAFLQAVKATGNNRILSTPQLLTLNREPASIVVGQNVPFITGQTTSGATPASDPFQTIVRQDVGVTLEVTPFITPANAIELQVNQSASSVADDKTAADIITNTRRIATRVQLQDGEGVLLGGLRSEQTDRSVSAVPLLSDIPLLGGLFRSTSRRTRTTNLVVLLTARIHGAQDTVKVRDPVRPLALPALSAAEPGVGAAGEGLGRAGAGRETSL